MSKKSPTIRRWLLGLVLTAVLPTFLATVATLLHAYDEEQEAVQKGLRHTTRALSLVIDGEIDRREAIAATLAGSPTLTRGDLRAFYEYATQIAPTRDKVVVLHALDGSQLLNTRVPFGAPLPASTRLADGRAAIGPTATLVSNLYFAPVGKQYSFAVQVPVIRDGKPVYYLSVAGYASALQSVLALQQIPEGWFATVVDAKGVVVARSVAPEQFVGKLVSERMQTELQRTSEGAFDSKSIDGVPVLATYSKSPNYGWAVIVGVPLAVLPGTLKGLGTLAALSALLLTSSLAATVWIARRLLAPVDRLKHAAEAMGSGLPVLPTETGLHETDLVLQGLRNADTRIRQASLDLEARRAESDASAEALRRSNTHVQLATEAGGLGLFTWRPEQDKVEWHNEQLFKIFGLPATDQPINATRFAEEFLHPDDAESFSSAVEKAIADDLPFVFQGRIRLAPDGRQRWIEVRGRVDRSDGDLQIVGTVGDTTERAQVEGALRESEERLRLLANSIPNLAWMADASGDVTWYNDRWYDYTGSSLEAMRRVGWQSVHDPDTLPEVEERWTRSVATGETFEMPFVPLRGKDGQFRPFITRAVPLRNAAGNIVQWFGTNTDVSTLKRAEDELREADRRKDQFLAVLAHELRNPLAPITTAAEMLTRFGSNEPRVTRASEIITRQARHMTALLNDLLDVSRITRGLIKVELTSVNVATVIANALEQVRPLLTANAQTVVVEPAPPEIAVVANALRLTQVVANLLDNAAKYSKRDARIEIQVQQVDARVRVAVVDPGEGISAELLPRVFDAFVQGERGVDRTKGGLGLGLAVVRGLVELQGGTVSAHSDGAGRGSRFVVDLAAAGPGPRVPQDEADATSQASCQRLCLLLVDDNVDGLEMLGSLLRELGHDVRSASKPSSALALAAEQAFDAAILDIGLPEMSGYELAAAVRAIQPGLKTLIALSGYGQPQDLAASFKAGFAHHLVKPVDPKGLMELLAAL